MPFARFDSARRPVVAFAVAGAVFSLLGAGCGGGSPTVAGGVSPQAGSEGGAPARSGTAGGRAGFIVNIGNPVQGARFSACIRMHGEPNFPDPDGRGVITVVGLDRHSPTFESAMSACRQLLPSDFGQGPTPAQQAEQRRQALAYSRCMRAHGIKDFPDPSNGGGFRLNRGPGSDLDPGNPRLQSAEAGCRSVLPGSGIKGVPVG